MEKKHLYVLVIAAIVGLMLILPASAAISFQKYTPIVNTMFKTVATPIPVIPVKNVPIIVQPELVPWTQTPVDSKIFKPSKFNSSGFQIRPIPTVIPVSDTIDRLSRDTWWVTVTVWNKDHTRTVPDTSIKFYALVSPDLHCSDDGLSCPVSSAFKSELIGEGKTNSNGKFSINLFTGGHNYIKVTAKGPILSENGEQVYYSGGGDLSYTSTLSENGERVDYSISGERIYESRNLEITLWFRNIVQ